MNQFAIGVDIGGTDLKGVVMDPRGNIRRGRKIPTEAHKGGKKILENMLGLVGLLLEKEKLPVAGIGIGTPGFVSATGTVMGAKNLPGWEGIGLYKEIKKRFGLPAIAANDVTAATLAEARFGAGKGVENLVFLSLGTGIGGGMVLNGQLYKGTRGMAGEFGHISIENNGLKCKCGQNGCVECYSSATGIVKAAIELSQSIVNKGDTSFSRLVISNPRAVTSEIVYNYVRKKDPVAKKINEMSCDKLARIIGIIINALSPDRIILGGGVMNAGRVIINTTSRFLPLYCLPEIRRHCRLLAAQCGEHAGAMGAAQLVFEELVPKRANHG